MKKIYLSLLTALAGYSLNAQTLTATNHAPANGDVFSTWQCDSAGITAGASGAGATWNYASIVTHTSVVKNYTSMTNTNTSYPVGANAMQVGSSASNMSYYDSSPIFLRYYGGNITIGTVNATLVYTTGSHAAAMVYPMSLGSISNSVTAGNITVSSIPGTFTGLSSVTADGTGTLVLPSGTYNNVIRVVTTQTINFNIPIAGSGTVTQKNWDYYNMGTKEPMFTITTSSIVSAAVNSTQTIVTRRNPAIVTGITTNNYNAAEVTVYPNPSTTNVNFATENTDAKTVIVYDVTGKLIEKQNLTEGKLSLDVSSYTNGSYIYSIIGSDNQPLKTGMISVNH